ncbi:uncharacterized protein EKO05_0003205 [Ascochyta rabiei]|uniref:uncharacterized protein n=1 Tax=Didymella rabiei TaxID=5454 RepID=UPI0021FA0218|nr:uncharacterized protein EKO05_0003205 [Ascochyta rabiei]UPX12664.1 hypothetical protein EKO05_0003205 [Ascochyta rabiei]
MSMLLPPQAPQALQECGAWSCCHICRGRLWHVSQYRFWIEREQPSSSPLGQDISLGNTWSLAGL